MDHQDLVVAVPRGLMLRDTDVPMMMLRVEAALARAHRTGTDDRPLFVHREGDSQFGIAPLRKAANITPEFFSGSGRPVVGRAIRFGKRVVRRSLRWYIAPIAEQQTRFNHAVLDLVERLRVKNETLEMQLELLRSEHDER